MTYHLFQKNLILLSLLEKHQKIQKNEEWDQIPTSKFSSINYLLQNLVVRPEIFNSIPLREFLEANSFKNYTFSSLTNMQVNQLQIHPNFSMSTLGSCMGFGILLSVFTKVKIYFSISLEDLFFVINSDMNVLTRVDAYLTNMKMPWLLLTI